MGTPLLSLSGVTSSFFYLSPQALPYYLPTYLLTAIPFLIEERLADLRGAILTTYPMDFLELMINVLIPPADLEVWAALKHLPSTALDPWNRDLQDLSEREHFLRFVGQFALPKRRAIGQFVEFTCIARLLYATMPDCFSQEEIAKLRHCWVEPMGE